MKRDYDSGVADDIVFFVGTEIEHTPAFGMRTLFVVGVQKESLVVDLAMKNNCQHIYLGANQSFQLPTSSDDSYSGICDSWERMTKSLMDKGFWVTLDFDIKYVEPVLDMCLAERHNFIPQVSVKIPYARQLGYNACIKIDDKDFRASNEGVWVHQLHDLMDRTKFTDWSAYGKDQTL